MALVYRTPQSRTSSSGSSDLPGFSAKVKSLKSFSNGPDLDSADGLLSLAQAQGGAISQVAEELTHPERGILSTIGNGFKKAFSGFVDVISVSNQVVAGAISSEYTIGEAIDQNISTSDVLLGKADPNASTMKKVGNFFVRTAVDILLDPLTYVTFGAGAGFLGLKSTSKIALGTNAASKVGKEAGALKALSETGQNLLNKKIEAQVNGLARTFEKTGKLRGMADDELADFVNKSISQNLDRESAKKALSRLIEKNPALTETLLDKGGIKFFGQSLVSGHRIGSAIKLVPGFTMIDNATAPIRNAMGSLFDNSRSLTGKIPEEAMNSLNKWKDIGEAQKTALFNEVPQIWKKYGITAAEDDLIRSAVELNKIPADPRLAEVWKILKGYEKKNLRQLWDAGIKVTEIPNYIPHFLVDEPVKSVPFSLPPSTQVKAAKQAGIAKFVDDAGKGTIGSIDSLGLKPVPGQAGQATKFTGRLVPGIADKLQPIALRVHDTTPEGLLKLREVVEANKEDILKEFDSVDDFIKTIREISELDEKTFERVRATVEEAETIGVKFDKSGISTLVKGSLDVIRGTTMKNMINELGSKFGVVASKAPDGFVGVSIKGLKEETTDFSKFVTGVVGEELFFHPEIAKRIETFAGSVINDEATNKVLQSFDKLQNAWKASVTSIFPAFHGRNAISNVFLNFLDLGYHALNPVNHIAAANLIKYEATASKLAIKMAGTSKEAIKAKDEFARLMSKEVFKDKQGYTWTFGEMRRAISDNNVAFNPNITGAIDVKKPTSELLDELLPATDKKGMTKKIIRRVNPLGQSFGPFAIGRKVGNIVEEQARLLNFMSNLRATGDVMHAAQRTKQFLFDYQNLTPFEKTFMRRVIPFYTFTRKNIELQAKTLLTTPGRTAAELTALTTLGDVLSGGELTDEERDMLPEWMRSGLGVLKERRGSTVEILQGFGTPIEQPFQFIQPNQLLGSISPLVRLPTELMSGYSFFHGKELSDVTNAAAFKSAPKFLQDFIGFTEVKGKYKDGTPFNWYVSLRPSRMHLLLNLPPTGRVFSSLKQMQDVDVSEQSRLMQFLVGVKPFSFDLEEEEAKREKELKRKLEDALTKAGVTGKFTRTFIPKD